MHKLEIVDINGELGVVLPDKVLARLGVGLGDERTLTDTANGLILSGPPGPDDQMTVVRPVMAKRQEVLKRLAD